MKRSVEASVEAGECPANKKQKLDEGEQKDPTEDLSWDGSGYESEDDWNGDMWEQYLWHFGMLHDKPRNEWFTEEIKKAITKIKTAGKEVSVLDIGTGSGLLSILAVKHGATRATACDSDPVLIQIAKKNAEKNGVASQIKFMDIHSSDLELSQMKDDTKANLVIGEVLDSGLIGEDALVSMRDVIENLCEADPVVVPGRIKLYGQLVSSEVLAGWNGGKNAVPGCPATGSTPFSVHLKALLKLDPSAKVLSEPFDCNMPFDFAKPPDSKGRIEKISVPVTESGSADAVVFYWSDESGTLSTNPDHASQQKRDHWSQAVSILKEPLKVESGKEVDVYAMHNDLDIWFSAEEQERVDGFITNPTCICPGQLHVQNRSEYSSWRSKHRAGKKSWQAEQVRKLIASKTDASADFKVLDLSEDPHEEILALPGRVAPPAPGPEEDMKNAESEEPKPKEVENFDAIVVEPFFEVTASSWGWEAFIEMVQRLAPYLEKPRPGLTVLPSKVSIVARLVCSDTLFSTRSPISAPICGLDLT